MEIDDDIAEAAPAVCAACGATAPRGDMFGVEPDLRCEDCAAGVRKRMHVRFKPVAKDHLPRATALVLAIAGVLFLCSDVIWPQRPGSTQPAWLQALYQDWGIWGGAVWKHLTSCLLHGGFLHLIMNAAAMLWLGRPLEQRFGTGVFVGLLLATGMAGGAMEWIVQDHGSVGLSGVIFGFAGFLMARRSFDPLARELMTDRNIRMVLGWGLLCVVLTMLNIMPIANWAHGAGLGVGWLIGWASGHARRRLLVPAAAMVSVVLVVASVFVALGTTTVSYDGRKTWQEVPRAQVREEWLRENR